MVARGAFTSSLCRTRSIREVSGLSGSVSVAPRQHVKPGSPGWLRVHASLPTPARRRTYAGASGAVALLLTVFVGYSCLWALGLEVGTIHTGEAVPLRVVVHGVLGCAVFGAVVVKVVAVRARRAPGWFLPVAGGLLFTLLLVVVLTSAAWYVAARGWPGPGGY